MGAGVGVSVDQGGLPINDIETAGRPGFDLQAGNVLECGCSCGGFSATLRTKPTWRAEWVIFAEAE